ncbi:MAG: hypothetical protein SA339_05810 [Methanomassiliicoccus sp.]|nr:hypothetical protein [Methanomassiliicoccus sp.]
MSAPSQPPMQRPASVPYKPTVKKSNKKLVIIGVVVIVAVLIIAAAAMSMGGNTKATDNNGSNNGSNDNSNNNNTNTQTRDQIANKTYSGVTDTVTQKFSLQAGVTIFHMKSSATSNFIVWLYNDTGVQKELLANEIGAYNGAQLVGVKDGNIIGVTPGQYYMQVTSNAAWSIVVEQPRVSSAAALPKTLTGTGPNVTIPIQLNSGVAVFDMTYTGTSNFIVTLTADNGDYVEYLANEIGSYTGQKSVTVNGGLLNASPGIHWINVDSSGDWTITVKMMA